MVFQVVSMGFVILQSFFQWGLREFGAVRVLNIVFFVLGLVCLGFLVNRAREKATFWLTLLVLGWMSLNLMRNSLSIWRAYGLNYIIHSPFIVILLAAPLFVLLCSRIAFGKPSRRYFGFEEKPSESQGSPAE